MKNSDTRKQTVIRMLDEASKLTVEEVMGALGVSESTVRRLFARLEDEGICIRAYGGICRTDRKHGSGGYLFEEVELENPDEKSNIGKAAARLIRSGDFVYLDSGTTVMSLGAAIADIFRSAELADAEEDTLALAEELSGATVFTHSLVNFELLNEYMKVFLLGGEYRDAQRDFCGYLTERAIDDLRFSKCFIGADGYSAEDGLLANDFKTAGINRLVTKNSSFRVLLADSSKFRRPAAVSYASFSEVDCLVTDIGLSADARESLSNTEAKIIIAEA